MIASAVAASSAQAEFRPDVPEFYSSIETVEAAVKPRCSWSELRELRLLLDVARQSQMQIDCKGFLYRGKERVMELMFSDGELDLVIVLIDEEDYAELAQEFRETYGEVTHDSPIGQFYYYDAVAIRTRPYEVVFTSKRTRANYQLYMDAMAKAAEEETDN